METVYLFNKPGVSDSYFFEDQQGINHNSLPYNRLRQAIEQAGFRFQIYHEGDDLRDALMLSFCYAGPPALQAVSQLPKNHCLILIPEPPSLLPYLYDPRLKSYFGTIFTLLDDLVDNRTYFKFYHPAARRQPLTDLLPFEERKLGILVHSNLSSNHPLDIYRERHRLAADFSHYGDEFDLFGSGWGNYAIYRGRLSGDKIDHLQKYKFYFAYENTRDLPGYVTERIFDAFVGGCVPIYWGASNIDDYVPKSCFIDRRDFASNQELYRFLKSVDAKMYTAYREAALAYLQTPKAALFSPEHFARTIVERIEQCVR